MKRNGFTLVELLTAVVIVTILVAMAVPLYEKTIERSHLAEARTLMHRLQAAKLAAMSNMDCENYGDNTTCPHVPQLQHLRVAFVNANDGTTATGTTFQSEYFRYSLGNRNDTYPNGVCAKRTGGDYAGTVFAYYAMEDNDAVFVCRGSSCEDYGYTSDNNLVCSDFSE